MLQHAAHLLSLEFVAYPHYDELELPLLKLLYEHGGELHQMRALHTYEPLANYFGLNELDRIQTRAVILGDGRDEPFWNNMVQWARRKLNARGFLITGQHGFWRLSELGIKRAQALATGNFLHTPYPDEIPDNAEEGALHKVAVNAYERSAKARQACIDHYGYLCVVCKFDFEARYGERGKNFVHVHHIVPLSSIGKSYVVDPIKDLRPICPNCHSIIHRTDPPCSIEHLQSTMC